MATVATNNCARSAPHLLTKTWIITPSYLHYRAGKSILTMKPLAYRFFTDVIPRHNIKHSPRPYRVSHHPNRISTPTRRSFHSSPRYSSKTTSTAAHFSLHVAAASSGKGRKYEADKSTCDFKPDGSNALGLQAPGSVFEKRRARPDSGEDAYFISTVGSDTTTIALGVCDGVGGWSEQGINPADFSHGMCSYMAEHAISHKSSDNINEALHPKKLLHVGYDKILSDTQVKAGGATACVATADSTGRIRTANLGDSGFVHIRLGTVYQYSTPQTHAFNTPFQLSKTPHEILVQAAMFGGMPLNDSPDRADESDHQLQHGDIVVFATDGVWDNLSSQDILSIVSKQMQNAQAWERKEGKPLQLTNTIVDVVKTEGSNSTLQSVIASHIVGEAKIASHDKRRDGPFAKAVQREYPMERFHGGKVDDITALVLIALENKPTESIELKAKL